VLQAGQEKKRPYQYRAERPANGTSFRGPLIISVHHWEVHDKKGDSGHDDDAVRGQNNNNIAIILDA
jgi:hypothetical protein